jgi:predicted alpha/beta-hydrolase family hydrolase
VEIGGGDTVEAVVFRPADAGSLVRVIASHGFARTATQMSGWGEHLASWGLEVVTPALLHASPFDTDHEANGRDLNSLHSALGGGAVIFAGHSAGGLASILAASGSADAVAVVGLDLVDNGDLGLHAAAGLSIPVYGLVGTPSDCNDTGNGVAVYGVVSDAQTARVAEADHCDFEDETDWMCTTFCEGTNDRFTDAEIQDTIKGMATAAIYEQAGLGMGLDDWWQSGGVFYDDLATLGLIE